MKKSPLTFREATEKYDGKQLQALIEKSKTAGVQVNTVIGDTAYSEKDNILYTQNNEIELVAKLNPQTTQGGRKKEDEFLFNKDAGMYVCPAGQYGVQQGASGQKRTRQKPEGYLLF